MGKGIFPGWWQVVAAMVVQAIGAASIHTCYSVLAVQYSQAFEPSRVVLALGITLVSGCGGLLGTVIGPGIDRFPMRRMMLVGLASLVTGFLVISIAPSMSVVLASYAVFMSVAAILLGPLSTAALLSRWFARRRGMAMGIAATGSAIGGLILPPLLQGLIAEFEWRDALRIFALLQIVVVAPVVVMLIVDRPSDRGLHPDGAAQSPAASAGVSKAAATLSTRELYANPDFWLIAFTVGMLFGGPVALSTHLMPLAIGRGVEAASAALLLSVISGANFVGKLLCAAAADRVDVRYVFGTVIVIIATGMYGYADADTFVRMAMCSTLIGFAAGGAVPLWSFLVARYWGTENFGRAMGQMRLFVMPFNLCAAPVFGLVFDRSGSYAPALLGYCVVLAVALLLVTRIGVHSRRKQAERQVTPASG